MVVGAIGADVLAESVTKEGGGIDVEGLRKLSSEAKSDILPIAVIGIGGIGVVGYLAYKYLRPGELFKEGFEDLYNALKGGTDWIWGQTAGFFGSAGDFISGGLSDVGDFFGGLGGSITEGLGDVGSTLKFWRVVYNDMELIVEKEGENLSGESAKMTYVFKDGSGIVSEGTLEETNEMKIPSNVRELIVEVPSKDFKESIKFK